MKDRAERITEILGEVKRLAAEYQALTGRPLGVTGELGEHVAAGLLGLELAEAREKSFDAIRRRSDNSIERIQIKARACPKGVIPKGRLSRISKDAECDTVVLVLLDVDTLDPWAIHEASFAAVRARLDEPGSRSRNERGQLSASDFLRLPDGRQIWRPD